MNKILLTLVAVLFSSFVFGQSPIGVWKNIDDEDGLEKSHIEVFEEEGKLYAKVIKLLPAAEGDKCLKCKGDLKNVDIVGLQIVWDMTAEDDYWTGGRILDPKSGKDYKCKLSMASDDEITVRGYIGSPLFGRSQSWYRVTE